MVHARPGARRISARIARVWRPRVEGGRLSGYRGLRVLEVLRGPRFVLETAGRERRPGAGFLVVGLWSLLSLALTLVFVFGGGLRPEQFPELPPAAFEQLERGLRVFVPLSALLFPFVWWLGVSALMHLTVRLFGGRAAFPGMLAVVGIACAPWVAGYLVQLPVGLLQLTLGEASVVSTALGWLAFAVSAGALLWHVYLVVLGTRLTAGTSPAGTGASCALAGLGCLTATFFLALTLITMAVALSRGVGG